MRQAMRREYAVAVFVVHDGAVLFHWHRKLGRWLPVGGHVDQDELPSDAAIRETMEEAGLAVTLIDALSIAYVDVPRPAGVPPRLPQPIGIQLEDIPERPENPAHQHIDLCYAAVLVPGTSTVPKGESGTNGDAPRWVAPTEWSLIGVTAEVASWAQAALTIVGTPTS